MKKLLIIAIYPAPYRYELIEEIRKEYEADVFFEHAGGHQRDASWFSQGDYSLLDTPEGKARFDGAVKNLKQYDLVICYDFNTRTEISLILRCRLAGVPYFLNADGVMMTDHGSFLRDAVKRFLIRGAAGCFASGRHAEAYFVKYGAKKENVYRHTFSTLHPGDLDPCPAAPEEQAALREKLGFSGYEKVAIGVGRFIALKRYDALIRAGRRCRRAGF